MNVECKIGHYMKSRSRPRFGNFILQSIESVPNVSIGLNKLVMIAKQLTLSKRLLMGMSVFSV